MTDISMMANPAARGAGSSSKSGSQDTRVAKNALTLEDFYKLMAVQLQNQDMTSPMDNSEMLNQLVQMATIEAMSQMTLMSTDQYAAGLLGQQTEVVTIVDGKQEMIKGTVTGVNLAFSPPAVYLDGKSQAYPMTSVIVIGQNSGETDDESGDKPPEVGEDHPQEGPGTRKSAMNKGEVKKW